jgi:hypothetical protein
MFDLLDIISNQMSQLITSNLDKSDDTCCICLANLPSMAVMELDCGHIMHTQCGFRWIISDRRCPICRTESVRLPIPPRNVRFVVEREVQQNVWYDLVHSISLGVLVLTYLIGTLLRISQYTITNLDHHQLNIVMIISGMYLLTKYLKHLVPLSITRSIDAVGRVTYTLRIRPRIRFTLFTRV